jgi:hypothetical protein
MVVAPTAEGRRTEVEEGNMEQHGAGAGGQEEIRTEQNPCGAAGLITGRGV